MQNAGWRKDTAAYRNEHNRLLGYIRKRIPVSVEADDILPSVGTAPDDEDLKEMIWETIEETLGELADSRIIPRSGTYLLANCRIVHPVEDSPYRCCSGVEA